MPAENPSIEVFNRDASRNEGYLYTATARLSCRLATQRTTGVILGTERFAGRSVIDLGCGDGFYTIQLWDKGRPRSMIGIDPASSAIDVANRNKHERPIQFQVGDAHALPFADNSFDVALLQSVLHHDTNPPDLIREAFRLAPEIIIHEPNGNNVGLKIIEKISLYHREHHERSYTSRQLRRWVELQGGHVVHQRFAGFVAMFSPDWLARVMKTIEPMIESIPFVNALGCAVIVLVATRSGSARGLE
jgi:ubiquinone/menaquinone biosynthesis C-methylase UbiE